jgi:hypothetical protein
LKCLLDVLIISDSLVRDQILVDLLEVKIKTGPSIYRVPHRVDVSHQCGECLLAAQSNTQSVGVASEAQSSLFGSGENQHNVGSFLALGNVDGCDENFFRNFCRGV